ncbi:MAG: GTPase Era [Longimicrobiales bacterium]
MTADTTASATTRAGYVAIVGLPNAGKSTVLNHFVGEHLSIASAKAQTTWQRVTGILTEGSSQIVFLDTPGLLEPRDLLQRAMRAASQEAVDDADVVLLVVDALRRAGAGEHARTSEILQSVSVPLHVALNKIDEADADAVRQWEAWAETVPGARIHRISARTGTGTAELLEGLRSDLPVSPFYFPEDEIASAPVRFFVAELVRETIFERYHQEIPYSVYCEVTEFRESQDPVYVGVDIMVERPSQKGILIGKGGAAIRELGTASRAKIEHLLGRGVYLDLWVKPLEWRRNRAQLTRLGFRPPPDDDGTH